jgi:hypothetical protein
VSDTAIDMAKVTQMLDAGWDVRLHRGAMGTYEVRARHPRPAIMRRVRQRLEEAMAENQDFLATTNGPYRHLGTFSEQNRQAFEPPRE